METRQSRGALAVWGVVSFSISLCAATVLAAVALSHVPGVSAQAPDGRSALTEAAIPDAGDLYLIPPDTDVGPPIAAPPDGGEMLLDELIEVDFIQPPVTWDEQEQTYVLDSAPILCPVQKPPFNQPKALVIADGTPALPWHWYYYEWEPPCDPTDGDRTFYSTTSTSNEKHGDVYDYNQTATVSFYEQNLGGATNTSGYIRVFDADLTLDGLPDDRQDTTEDGPNVWMGVGSGRRKVTLNLVPADPNDVMPRGFLRGQPHHGRAPYNVMLTKGSGVKIYGSPDAVEPLTTLEWGYTEDYPQEHPQMYYEHPTPTAVWVEAVSGGSVNLQLTLTFRAVDEVEGWAPDRGGDGTNVARDQVNLNVLEIVTETVSDSPTDRSRKLLGVGEKVNCRTQPEQAADWDVVGEGALTAKDHVATTQFTAPMLDNVDSIVKATANGTTAFAPFNIIAPTGVQFTGCKDERPWPQEDPNNGTWIGGRAHFNLKLLPVTVSFHWIVWQEELQGLVTTWPNGHQTQQLLERLPGDPVGYNNVTQDYVGCGTYPKEWLNNMTGEDFTEYVLIFEQWQDKFHPLPGPWPIFAWDVSHSHRFNRYGGCVLGVKPPWTPPRGYLEEPRWQGPYAVENHE